MEGIGSVWSKLDMRRRIIVIGASLAMFAAVLGLARGAGGQDLALLYAGLDPAAAGGVLAALDQRGVTYDVRGDAVWVPAADRDLLRLSLAGEGLPESSARGYELLDSLSGFGTTAQMFDAAYWRAKEGELARTILSVPGIRSARVHISTAATRPFARDVETTAAVTVGLAGGVLSAEQARALRHLVASSVAGLAPADVAVIDADNGLVPADDPVAGGETRAEALRAQAMRLLEARVGPGNAVVEVTVETVMDTESIVERRIEPDSRTAISTEVEERASTAQDSGGGDVTVASNLPDGDAGGDQGNSQSEDSETRTLTNYDLSETSREVLRAPGAIRRMSVAVLVNGLPQTAADGTVTTEPRPEEELTALRDLVSSAVGLDTARGDVITIQSMPFEPISANGTEGVAASGFPIDMMTLIQLGVLAAVALILGLFVLRPILAPRRLAAAPALPPPAPDQSVNPPLAAEGAAGTLLAGPGTIDATGGTSDVITDAEIVDPVARLRRLIESRQDETIQILQTWIEDPGPRERV